MVRNARTWISWKPKITFLWNKEILNLCLRWYIFRNYPFVVEVTFNSLFKKIKMLSLAYSRERKYANTHIILQEIKTVFIWLYMEGLYYSKSCHFSVFGKIHNFHKFGKILQNCWNYRIGVSSLMNFNNSMKNNISMIRSSKYYICNCEQRNQKYFFGDFRQRQATLLVQTTKVHKQIWKK